MKSGLKDCLAKFTAIAFYKILLSLLSPNGKSTTNLDLFSILGLCFVLTKNIVTIWAIFIHHQFSLSFILFLLFFISFFLNLSYYLFSLKPLSLSLKIFLSLALSPSLSFYFYFYFFFLSNFYTMFLLTNSIDCTFMVILEAKTRKKKRLGSISQCLNLTWELKNETSKNLLSL